MSEQNKRYKRSFIEGAMILSFSTILVKVIGAFFRIPLTNIITEEAMSYFNNAYTIYNFMFVLSTSGLPATVSRMVATNIAKGRGKDSKRLLRIAFSTYSVVGFIASVVMFAFADVFAKLINNPDASIAIRAIAPAVLFISVVAPIKGFFQGHRDMTPTAVGNIIEAASKLVVGLLLAVYLKSAGAPLHIIAAGAIVGVTLGTVFSALYNLLRYLIFKKKNRFLDDYQTDEPVRSTKDIFREFITTAVPITLGAITMHLSNLIDLMLVMRQLGAYFTNLNPDWLAEQVGQQTKIHYGAYSSMVTTLTNFPATVIYTIGISVIPVIASSYALNDKAKMHESVTSSLKVASLLSIPCVLVLAVFSKPILSFLYFSRPNGVEIAWPLMTMLSFSIFTVCLSNITNNILQAVKRPVIPVMHLLIGGVIKIVSNYILIGKFGITGAPIATNLSYIAVFCLNMLSIRRIIKIKLDIKNTFIKPLVSYALGIGVSFGIYKFLMFWFSGGTLMNALIMFASLFVSVIIYASMLIITKTLDKNDILLLPKGTKLLKILEKKGWIV